MTFSKAQSIVGNPGTLLPKRDSLHIPGEGTGTWPDYLVNRDDQKNEGQFGGKIARKSRNSCCNKMESLRDWPWPIEYQDEVMLFLLLRTYEHADPELLSLTLAQFPLASVRCRNAADHGLLVTSLISVSGKRSEHTPQSPTYRTPTFRQCHHF